MKHLEKMATLSQLRKEAKTAPKFILIGIINGNIFYIGQMKSLTDLPLVSDIESAVKFSVGFDDEQMKSRAWSMTAKMKGLNTKFSPLYL